MTPRRAASARGPTRRRLLVGTGLAGGGLALAAAVDGFLVTPGRLQTTDHSLGGPGGNAKLRLAQVSDLHLRSMGRLETRLLAALHESTADLLLFTGDMVDRRVDLWRLETFLRECPPRPRRFAILGNWEHWSGVPVEAFARLYDRHGVELLVNRSVEVAVAGTRLRITGLDDLRGGHPDASAALGAGPPSPNHLVLAHCPHSRDAVAFPAGHRVDLMLAGHTHGGQVAVLGRPLALPEGSGRYVAGWYRDSGPAMYVSRGIGTSLLPLRLGTPPELVRIDWSLA